MLCGEEINDVIDVVPGGIHWSISRRSFRELQIVLPINAFKILRRESHCDYVIADICNERLTRTVSELNCVHTYRTGPGWIHLVCSASSSCWRAPWLRWSSWCWWEYLTKPYINEPLIHCAILFSLFSSFCLEPRLCTRNHCYACCRFALVDRLLKSSFSFFFSFFVTHSQQFLIHHRWLFSYATSNFHIRVLFTTLRYLRGSIMKRSGGDDG